MPTSSFRLLPAPSRRMPEQRGADRVCVQRLMRFAGEQLEHRGELGAAADVAKHERRPAVSRARTMSVEVPSRRSSQRPRRLDVADVVDGKLVFPAVRDAHQPEVGQAVAACAAAAGNGRSTAAVPRAAEIPRPVAHRVLKLTFGTCLASAGASKNGYSLKPNAFAVRFPGNCRREVLYSCTRSL